MKFNFFRPEEPISIKREIEKLDALQDAEKKRGMIDSIPEILEIKKVEKIEQGELAKKKDLAELQNKGDDPISESLMRDAELFFDFKENKAGNPQERGLFAKDPDPEGNIYHEQLRILLVEGMGALKFTEFDKAVINNTLQGYTIEEIAQMTASLTQKRQIKIGNIKEVISAGTPLSGSRIRQIQKKLLERLKHWAHYKLLSKNPKRFDSQNVQE